MRPAGGCLAAHRAVSLDRLTVLTLHPISLGFGLPRAQRGRPILAAPALGEKIIADVRKFSATWGTVVDDRDGIGVVTVPH